MWLEEKIGRRISEMRFEQAAATGAQVIATACPFCLQMFEDAARVEEKPESIIVKDIAELVADSMLPTKNMIQ
jgi:Fe-S oxidoreductase